MFSIGSLRSLLTEIIELKTLMYKGLNNDVYKHINPGQDRVYVRKIKELIDTYLWIKNIKKQELKIGKCPHINECLSANKTLTIDCENIDLREDYWCFSKPLPKLKGRPIKWDLENMKIEKEAEPKDEFDSLINFFEGVISNTFDNWEHYLDNIDKLKQIKQNLDSQIHYLDNIEKLRQKSLDKKNKHLEIENKMRNHRIDRSLKRYEQDLKKIKALNQEIEKLKQIKLDFDAHIKSWQSDRENLKAEIQDLNEVVNQHKNNANNMFNANNELLGELGELEKEKEILEKENQELKQRLEAEK